MKPRYLAVILLALAACHRRPAGPPPPAPEEQAEVDRLLAPLRDKARAREEERKRGLVEAAKLVARPDLGACPVRVDLPDPRHPSGGFDLDRMKRETDALARVELMPLKPGELATVDGPLYHAFTNELSFVRRPNDARRAVAELGDSYWNYDVVIVEESRSDAQRAGGAFVAGAFRGRALLWSFPQHKVLCIADVATGSSSKIRVTTVKVGGRAASDDFRLASSVDLTQNVIRDSLAGLVLAGPAR